jgi:hypothetical protein
MRQDETARSRKIRIVSDPNSLGLTEPNAAGRRYRHAKLTGCVVTNVGPTLVQIVHPVVGGRWVRVRSRVELFEQIQTT